MAITLVCFDLGRVLVRISDSWSDAFARAGLAHFDIATRLRERATEEALSRHVRTNECGDSTTAEFCSAAARVLGCDVADLEATLDAYVHGAYPGATTLLDDVHAAGLRTACLSNTNLRHFAIMEGWVDEADRVLARIDVHGASHALRLRKPAAAIYEALEQRAGVGPAEILFFDDLPDNVAAARARGWAAEEVRSREDPIGEMRAHLRARGIVPK